MRNGRDVRAIAFRTLAISVALLVPSVAAAVPPVQPDVPEVDTVRFEASLYFENDNKFFGVWQVLGRDGTDTGRTHGTALRLAGTLRHDLRWDLEVASNLFTEQLYDSRNIRLNVRREGGYDPLRWKHRNIWFNEISTFRFLLTRRFRHSPDWEWVLGTGALVSNHQWVGPGAAGQQKWFHKFLDLFSNATREYRYIPDSYGVYGGLLLEAGLRYTHVVVERERFRFHVRSDLGTQVVTVARGSRLRSLFGVWLGFGRRRHHGRPVASLGLSQELTLYPHDTDGMWNTRVDLFLHASRCDVTTTFEGYYGSSHNSFFFYNAPNTTTTFGFRCRSYGGPRPTPVVSREPRR